MSENQSLPLSGLRVLEFTHAVMGPAAGLVLADLGADVIRVEPAPEGDHTRRLSGFGTGYYTFFNRNKRSLAVDVKTPEGYKIIMSVLPTVDILIENFSSGTMDRLGLGYETAAQVNPRLIYVSLKGFLAGPYENRPALDEVVQMMSGLAYMTGPLGQPLRAGASIVDIMGGTFGAMAALVALRERDRTGCGQFVKNGLFETAAFIMGQHMAYAAISQEPVPPMPERVSAWAVYRVFTSADGQPVFIGITSDKHWERFCKAFGQDTWLTDASLASNEDRIRQRDRLLPALEALFKTLTRAQIITLAQEAGIPFSPVAKTEDLFDDPHLSAGGRLVEVALPDGRRAKVPLLPLEIGTLNLGLRSDAPQLGNAVRDLLAEIGYDEQAVQRLLEAGVIAIKEQAP